MFTDIDCAGGLLSGIFSSARRWSTPGVQFLLRNEQEDGSFAEEEFFYENGIQDYVTGACRARKP